VSVESLWKRLRGNYFRSLVWLEKLFHDVRDPRSFETPRGWAKVLVGLAVMAGVIWVMALWMQRRRIAKLPPEGQATLWLARLLRKLRRRGLQKSTSQTAAQWAQTAPDGELRQTLAQFVREYESARFGANASSAAKLPELYEEVESALKK